jgi:hypothetical protein
VGNLNPNTPEKIWDQNVSEIRHPIRREAIRKSADYYRRRRMQTPRIRVLIILLIALLGLNACNFPRAGSPTPEGPELVFTYAAQTVAVQLTQSASEVQPSATPGETNVPPSGETPTPSLTPGETQAVEPTDTPPQPTATPEICDRAGFIEDVTFPDNSRVDPGADFTKTWRLKNTGTCTWNSNYAIVFDHGEAMGGPASKQLTTGSIPPGDTVDISVNLKAPETPGTYQGFWMLRNASGVLFGLGEKAEKEFWVKIQVGVTSGIAYDFIAKASSANWVSSGGGSEVNLAFGGSDDDPNGVAKLKENIKLEDGSQAGKTLITGPKHNDDGKITGTFSEYTVQGGDHFKAKLGFLDNCDDARVTYQLWYEDSGGKQMLKEWDKSCDGHLLYVDVDLNNLKTKKVKFILVVIANGSPSADLAIWGSARIER